MEADETNEDWQSNLTNWKSLRKSQSSYQRVQDLDPPEEVPQKPRAKTYKEMMLDRQRRKSSHGQHSVDDLDDDDSDFGSSRTQGKSVDDASQDVVVSGRLPLTNAKQKSFNDEEEVVGQILRYESEKTEGSNRDTKFQTNTDPPLPPSNNHLQKSNDKVPTDQQTTKVNTNHDFSGPLRDPKKSSNFSSHRDKFETGKTTDPPASAGKSGGDVRGRAGGNANFSDKLKMFNKPTEPNQTTDNGQKNSLDQKRTPGVTGKENVVEKNSANMFFEKLIRINQRPNHEKGFGFTISGGREHNAPIVVDKVVRGGSADICELKAGDEIITINGADVARHYNESVQNVLAQSVATGTIELKVKRLKDLDEDFEEEVFSDDELKATAVPKTTHNFSGSQSSLWSSPPCSPPAPPSADTSELFIDDLPPPPLPSVPPPPPNWNTFPGEVPLTSLGPTSESTPRVESLGGPSSFGAATDLGKKSGYEHRANEPRDLPDKSREDILKKKSQFLGLKLEESEELKALKGDQELKKLKTESSFSVSDSWNSSLHHPLPASNDLPPNKKSSFGISMENHSTTASSASGFTMHGGNGGGGVQAGWSNSGRLEADSKPDFAAMEESRKREEREQLKLREKEEQLKLMEVKIRQETEQLEREKRRIAQETEQQLSMEREKLRQESERQLQKERERLLREKEEQLRQDQQRLQREKEENLRHQNEEQLRREKQRMERDMEEQLRLERERLTREKDDAVKHERDRLQREQEVQKERLRREKEDALRLQSEEQLRREKQRLEKETEEKLRLERERLTREKDETLRQERERLQREQERQKKELQEQFRMEQQRMDQMEQQRQTNSNTLNRGVSLGYGSKSDGKDLSSEPSDLDVAEYSMKYGGKTFARLAAQTRSDSLGAAGPKTLGKDASFPRLGSQSEAGFNQEMQKPVSRKLEKADMNENFSSIRSNFDSSRATNAPSKVSEPAPWKPVGHLNDRYPDEQRVAGSAEYSQHPSMAPWHGRTASLGAQVTTERTATVEPQIRGQAQPNEPHFDSHFRSHSLLETQLGPQVGERTTSLGPGGRTGFGGKTLQEEQEALLTRNQYVSSVHSRVEEHREPPVVGERKASLGPQSREHGARLGPQFEEQRRPSYEDQTIRRPSTGEPSGDQSVMTPLSNISYLLYGDEQRMNQQNAESIRSDDTRPGGYNSYAQGYNRPSGVAAPPVDNNRMSTSNVQRDKGFPSYYPASSALSAHQFDESSLPPRNANTLPHPKASDSAQAKHAGPKPFEAPWKNQSSLADHWLVEEAERKRISEHTGQERSWNFGQEHPRELPPPEHNPDTAGIWAPVNPYASRPNAIETSSARSPRSVPEPVKQTLLNRINVGASSKPPTLLGPLPSYPTDYSHGPPSHSRSVSNPVTDSSHLYGNPSSSFPPPLGSAAPPPPHPSSGGGAVDSLFAYHRQVAQPEANVASQGSVSHSQGSLHLDGTPQYSSSSQSYKLQGTYPGPTNAPQVYHAGGTVPNVQAQGGQPYRIYATQEPGYSVGRDTGSFPSYCQPVVNNLLCTNCQRPLTEINGRVLMRDGDLKLHCQNCYQENEVKYSKV